MNRHIIKDKWWLKLKEILNKILHPAGATEGQTCEGGNDESNACQEITYKVCYACGQWCWDWKKPSDTIGDVEKVDSGVGCPGQ